jgi:transcriptional regulator with XRE-family HTH domain
MPRMHKNPKTTSKPDARFTPIARRLLAARLAIGLEQTDFARKARIAQNTYNQYEQAKRRPSLDNAIKLCKTYNLTLDWIYLDDPSGVGSRLWAEIRARLGD